MEDDVWTWKEMTILGGLHSPPQLWYHPACKVTTFNNLVSETQILPWYSTVTYP